MKQFHHCIGGQTSLPISPLRHISTYYIYILSKNYNTNITKIFETSKYFYYFLQFFCAYSWIRTNALPYPYGRFLCLSGLTDSISNISRHYFDSSVVSCSVYASNLYRQIIVGPPGLEPGWRDYESRILNLWITGPISFSKNFQTFTIQI